MVCLVRSAACAVLWFFWKPNCRSSFTVVLIWNVNCSAAGFSINFEKILSWFSGLKLPAILGSRFKRGVILREVLLSTAILIFLISWGPPFGFFDGNLWISYNKNPKGGPHEIRKIKIAVDLWYSLWWTLWVPKVSMSSFEKIQYWGGWKLPAPNYQNEVEQVL